VTERTVELEHDSERKRVKLSKCVVELEGARGHVREQARTVEGLQEALAKGEYTHKANTSEILTGFKGLQRVLRAAVEESGEEEGKAEEEAEAMSEVLSEPHALGAVLQMQSMQESWTGLCQEAGEALSQLRGARAELRARRAGAITGAEDLRGANARVTEEGRRAVGLEQELAAAMLHGRNIGDQLVVSNALASSLTPLTPFTPL
jgi:hypothetical protein